MYGRLLTPNLPKPPLLSKATACRIQCRGGALHRGHEPPREAVTAPYTLSHAPASTFNHQPSPKQLLLCIAPQALTSAGGVGAMIRIFTYCIGSFLSYNIGTTKEARHIDRRRPRRRAGRSPPPGSGSQERQARRGAENAGSRRRQGGGETEAKRRGRNRGHIAPVSG